MNGDDIKNDAEQSTCHHDARLEVRKPWRPNRPREAHGQDTGLMHRPEVGEEKDSRDAQNHVAVNVAE